jgi:dTDP-4-amino-4,6-dideoxygalactose transaminase
VTQVPRLDLTRLDPELEGELLAAFARFLRSGRYVLGPAVDELEAECAAYLGVKHAVGVSSGTDAILAALMVLGIGPGDEVVCPTFTFQATAESIWRTGARPVLVDCGLSDFNVSAAEVEARIGPRTRAVLPVHLFGQCAEMGPLADIGRARGVAVIEDAAQALGAEYQGRRAGTMGTIGCFSFFPSKNLGGFGDGGLCVTGDDALAEALRAARVHGAEPRYHHRFIGGNFRLDALQATLLLPKLRRLDGFTAGRRRNAELYTRLFTEAGIGAPNRGQEEEAGARVLLPVATGARHVHNQYVVRVPGLRDALRAFLAARGVQTEVYYPVPVHLQECFASLGHRAGDFPRAERAAREALALPLFPELSAGEIGYVVEQVACFFRA